MSIRNALVGVGIVIALLAGGWGVLVYEPAGDMADGPFNATVPDGPYEATMTIRTNGELFMELTVRNDTTDSEQLHRQHFSQTRLVSYWHDDRQYTYVNETREQVFHNHHLDTDENERVLRQDNATLTAVLLREDVAPTLRDETAPPPLVSTVMQYPPYERTGTRTYAGTEVAVYRPRTGWVKTPPGPADAQGIRVTDAEGVLYVDPDTEVLYHANVTYSMVRADTWGEYVHGKLVANEEVTTGFTYEFERGGTDVDRPEWASEDA